MDQVLLELAKAGPGYALAVWLLWQGAKERAAQVEVNTKVATTLALIRSLLAVGFKVPDPGKED